MIYYISDLHFGSIRTGKHTDLRGFKCLEEMNAYMIEHWNMRVQEDDEVIILGDFCVSTLSEDVEEVLRSLKGKKSLIIGNWDRYLDNPDFDRSLFQWIAPYKEIEDGKRKIVLSHYPIFCYNGQYLFCEDGSPKTFMLYGHVHNTMDETLVNSFIRQTRVKERSLIGKEGLHSIPCQMINCYSGFSDYIPLTLEEWIEVDAKRRASMEEKNG